MHRHAQDRNNAPKQNSFSCTHGFLKDGNTLRVSRIEFPSDIIENTGKYKAEQVACIGTEKW